MADRLKLKNRRLSTLLYVHYQIHINITEGCSTTHSIYSNDAAWLEPHVPHCIILFD